MQFKAIALAAIALLASPALGVTLSYDETYDQSGTSLANVACSDGSHGLLTKGFTTFGSLPSFPEIGGAAAVACFNSPNCGTCWQLTYNGKSINVLAIDHADEGFNIALRAMNTLTNGQAEQLGRIDVVVSNAGVSVLGEVEGTPDAPARNMFEVNFWGATHVLQEAVRFMREVNPPGVGGRIIQITSGVALCGYPACGFYSASKHGEWRNTLDGKDGCLQYSLHSH